MSERRSEREAELLREVAEGLVRTGITETVAEAEAVFAKIRERWKGADWSSIFSQPGIFALQRYFLWADRMHQHFKKILPAEPPADPVSAVMAMFSHPYMSYFYGALYVVIEGWRELGLHDAKIDALLASPNVELLRRYRNGSFHFQRDYFNDRFFGFIDAQDSATWVNELRKEFSRWFHHDLVENAKQTKNAADSSAAGGQSSPPSGARDERGRDGQTR